MNISKCIVSVMMVAVLTTGCLNASAGSSSNIPVKDFFGLKPTVKIEWPSMTLTVPTNYPSSVAYVSPKAKVEGENIIINAKYVLSKKPAATTFNLSKLGMKKEKASSAKVFWMNPDGTKHALEVKQADVK